MTPAEDMAKMQHLVAQIARFERLIEEDAPLCDVLPSIYKTYEEHFRTFAIRQLCQEMHDLYVSHDVKQLQKKCSMEITSRKS